MLYIQITWSSVPLADCSSLITWETQDGYTSTLQHLLLMMCNFTDTDFKPVCWVQSARCGKSKVNSPPQAAWCHRLQSRECVEMRSRGVMMMKHQLRLQQAAVNEILIHTVTVNTMLCSVLVLYFEIHEWTDHNYVSGRPQCDGNSSNEYSDENNLNWTRRCGFFCCWLKLFWSCRGVQHILS